MTFHYQVCIFSDTYLSLDHSHTITLKTFIRHIISNPYYLTMINETYQNWNSKISNIIKTLKNWNCIVKKIETENVYILLYHILLRGLKLITNRRDVVQWNEYLIYFIYPVKFYCVVVLRFPFRNKLVFTRMKKLPV